MTKVSLFMSSANVCKQMRCTDCYYCW